MQLRDFGVGTVIQCGRIRDARKQLEARPFDMVLCEHRFDAAESALDSYLLKPHTATSPGERLTQARKRKKVLADIFTAIEQGDHGMLAFYMGDKDEAAKMLDRAAVLGISSKMFDYQSLVLLAFARFG